MSQKYKLFQAYENGLKAAYDNYKKWQDNPELHTLNKPYKNRPPQTELFVNMFATQGIAAAVNVFYVGKATTSEWNTYKTKFTGYTKETVPATGIELRVPRGGRIARFAIKSGILATPTKQTSHITKRKYNNYGGITVSLPFGAKTATESMAEAFVAIQASLTIPATTKVSLIPEKFIVA